MNSVLIVEDEKLIRQGIKSMIQRSGVPVNTILECNNGVIALEILKTQKIDVMFTDIRMPKMDGIELVNRMQELEYKPMTVVISGYDDFSYAVHMLRSGVKEYILKPVDRDQITAILKRLNQEVEEREIKQKEVRNIGYQQLKYLLLNKNITPEETETIKKQFEELLFSGEYVVCCTEKQDKFTENDTVIFLNDVEENSVYIVDATNRDLLLRNELRGKYVGISALHNSLEEVTAAYKEAKKARSEAFFASSPEQEYLALKEQDAAQQDTLEQETVNQIAHMIGTDKMEDALLKLEKLAEAARDRRLSRESFAQGMEKLVATIKTTYQNVIGEGEEIKSLEKLYAFPNLDDFMEALTGWIIAFHEKVDAHFDDYKNKQKMKQAIEYIQENFYKDLNMAVVSNYVSMNYSLFSYIFKQYTGSNFVNYLKNLRIDMAKKLLEETDLRILEISQKVGYDNEKYFMKTFKSVCGVSPTEYRKNMQLNKQ